MGCYAIHVLSLAESYHLLNFKIGLPAVSLCLPAESCRVTHETIGRAAGLPPVPAAQSLRGWHLGLGTLLVPSGLQADGSRCWVPQRLHHGFHTFTAKVGGSQRVNMAFKAEEGLSKEENRSRNKGWLQTALPAHPWWDTGAAHTVWDPRRGAGGRGAWA